VTKLVIATPLDGHPESAKCAFGYAITIGRLLAGEGHPGLIDPGILGYPTDLTRARSLAVRRARDFGATGILWLDDDTVPKRGAVAAMLESGHDVIGCPYPRKRIHFERMSAAVLAGAEAEKAAYDYAFHLEGPDDGHATVTCVNGCVPVGRVSFGCLYTSMRALDAMWARFEEEDGFTHIDDSDGAHYDCVALFGLVTMPPLEFRGRRVTRLLSEDYSFCERYNRMRAESPETAGLGPIQLLVTYPADHVGSHLFRGDKDGLIYAR